jgi:hypothetical protein
LDRAYIIKYAWTTDDRNAGVAKSAVSGAAIIARRVWFRSIIRPIWEQAMAKTTDEKPDPKEIEKRIKEVNKVSEQLNKCKQQLKNATELVKDLDKLAR